MWSALFCTYVVGPVAALLPLRWRNALPVAVRVNWERAAALSGFLEITAVLVGLGYWYMFEMSRRISQIVNAPPDVQIPRGLEEHQIQGAALTIFYMSPLTWILFYFFFEGAVRLCGGAFAESPLGTMPLYLLDKALSLTRNRREGSRGEALRQTLGSFSESVRERLMVEKLKRVPDELHYSKSETEEMLEVSASSRKQEWTIPKIVRVNEAYYRLENSFVEKGPRPFRYQLRRLQAGVPGRSVLVYGTAGAIVKESRE